MDPNLRLVFVSARHSQDLGAKHVVAVRTGWCSLSIKNNMSVDCKVVVLSGDTVFAEYGRQQRRRHPIGRPGRGEPHQGARPQEAALRQRERIEGLQTHIDVLKVGDTKVTFNCGKVPLHQGIGHSVRAGSQFTTRLRTAVELLKVLVKFKSED